MAAAGVIIAVAGRNESAVAAAIDAHPSLTVARRCADLAEAVAAAAAGVGAVAVVSDQARLTRASVRALVETGTGLVGVPATPESGEQLLALGVGEVARAGASATEIADLAARAAAMDMPRPVSEPAPVVEDGRDGRVVAVWGPTGAPGRTTIAVNIAAEAARDGRDVVLVDADTYGGAVASALGLTDESPGVAGAVREAQHGTVDRAILERHALRVSDRLAVLGGLTRPERWAEVPGESLAEVLRAARTCADLVVVDCGFSLESDEHLRYDSRAPQRNAATFAAVEAADTVVAVGGAEPLGLQRLIHGLAVLSDAGAGQPVVVVNRVRADVAGPRPDQAVADVMARYAGIERIHTVPWDGPACDASALLGQALVDCAPRSRARKAIALIARAVTADAPSTPGRAAVAAATVGN